MLVTYKEERQKEGGGGGEGKKKSKKKQTLVYKAFYKCTEWSTKEWWREEIKCMCVCMCGCVTYIILI